MSNKIEQARTRLFEALKDSHHAATLLHVHWPEGLDVIEDHIQFAASCALDDWSDPEGDFGALCKDYGPLCPWGRGGASVLPERLVPDQRFSTTWDGDRWPETAKELDWLASEIERLNTACRAWCKALPRYLAENRLEYLRDELRAERISYGELAELQALAPFIEPGDVELLEAAGVPEFPEEVQA